MRGSVFWFLAMSIGILLGLPGAAEIPREEVVTIVSSNQGTVTKWAHRPKVVVFHDSDDHLEAIDRTIQGVVSNVPEFIGFADIEYVDIRPFGPDLEGRVFFRRLPREDHPKDRFAIFIRDGDAVRPFQADIYLVMTALRPGILFASVTAPVGQGHHLIRRYAEGSHDACFYGSLAREGSMLVAVAHVGAHHSQDCLYEEFMHTLGIHNDFVDSPHFTFDDRLTETPRYSNDYRLLRALYHDSILPGGDPSQVYDVFSTLKPEALATSD